MKIYIIIIILLFPVCCNAQQDNMKEEKQQSLPYILSETTETVESLTYMVRFDGEENTYSYPETFIGNGDFFLQFDIYSKGKLNGLARSKRRYMMHVIPGEETDCIKIRMEGLTFYEDGKNVGHTTPSGRWSDCGEDFREILDYYLSHKDEIIIIRDKAAYDKVDIGNRKLLLPISESSGQYMIDIWRNDSLPQYRNGDFILETELLGVSKAVNSKGEPINYSISEITAHFFMLQGRYYVRSCSKSTKTYTNGGQDVQSLTVANQWEDLGFINETGSYYPKILKYYLEHKSEIRTKPLEDDE